MKRAAYLFGALLASLAAVSAEPLPEPAASGSSPVKQYQAGPGSEFPAPDFGYSIFAFASPVDLWAESPDPAGIDLFDPSARASDLWGFDPDPQEIDPFSPLARLADLWSVAPVPAFDRGGAFQALDFSPVAAFAEEAATDASKKEAVDEVVLRGLLNNEYYRESIRLKKLAVEAFDYGDYDASASYAADAAAAAKKSDDYVALRLKIRAVDEALAKAKARIDWASKAGAEKTYAGRFAAASAAYEGAQTARAAENYDLALDLARKVLSELASVTETAPLPARYKVRPWASTKDCFWNIAAYSFVYGDARKWKLLYEANKAKLPRPENPNLLRVGTVLTIPSIRGEYREGVWEKGKTYSPLPPK